MALERKDLRLKLDADTHAALSLIADVTDREMNEIAEQLIHDYVIRRVHEANVIADRARRLGIAGSARESAGSGRESSGKIGE